MKNFAKSKGKRITAALLCAVMCIMSLPLSAFAFTAEEGKTVDAYYGDRYFGSDGDYYYSPESHQYIAYDENGNTSLHSANMTLFPNCTTVPARRWYPLRRIGKPF